MRKGLSLLIIIISALLTATASAQTRQDPKRYVEPISLALKVPARSEANKAVEPATSFSYPADDFKPGVVKVGPRTTYLKEGLKIDEVIRLLGAPSSISERKDKESLVTIYQFRRGEGQVLVAEFVSGALVRSRTEAREDFDLDAGR